MIFYLAYAVCVFVSLFFLVCVFLCYDMGVSPAINTNNNNNFAFRVFKFKSLDIIHLELF